MKKTIFFDRKLRIKYKLFEKKKKIYTYISKEVGKEILPLLHKKNLTGLNFSLEDQLFSSSSNNFLVDFRLLREAKPAKQGSFTLAQEAIDSRSKSLLTTSHITNECAENKIGRSANALGKKKEPKLIVPFQGANETINRWLITREAVLPANARSDALRKPEASNLTPITPSHSQESIYSIYKGVDNTFALAQTPTLARISDSRVISHTEELRDENANAPWAHQIKYKDNVFSYMVFNNLERIFKKLEKKKLFFYTRRLPTYVKVKNRCLLSSGSRSVYSKLRLGRQSLKKEIHLGSLPSFTKASF